MKIDVQSLGTINRLASEGAEQAAAAMTQMTGTEAVVDVTKISLVDRADAGEELGDGEFLGVQFGFEGALGGETALVFERDSTDAIAEALLPGGVSDDAMARSSVEEVGNVMMSGFIDGWADYLGATVDHTPPECVEATGAAVLPGAPAQEDDQIFVFRSEVEWIGANMEFYIYMLPEFETLAEVMADQVDTADDVIPVEKLQVFNRMTRSGTGTAADNVEMMTGIGTEAEVTQISFVPIEDVPRQVGTEVRVGTVVEFTGVPSGYVLVLFDENSAKTIAEALMPVEMDADGLTDRHEAAVEELGNIITSGFVDGWANVLETSVEHTPPRLVHDMGQAIVDPLAAQLGQQQRHAFTIESTMRTDEIDFACEIHALPDERQLRQALDDLVVERADQTEASVEEIF